MNMKYEHLKIFSCKTFMHILKGEISNFSAKSIYCTFVGYSEKKYGYKLHNHIQIVFTINHDVKTIEKPNN